MPTKSLPHAKPLQAAPGFTDRVLLDHYRRSHGHVAFIDESFRAPNQDLGLGNHTYYILTAVIVRRAKIALVRSDLRAIAAAEKWHTTEEGRTVAGRLRILSMCGYLADNSASVVVVRTKISTLDRDAEEARMACIERFLVTLCESEVIQPDGLVVFEQRQVPQQPADRATVNRLRSEGLIPSGLIVHFGSPRTESLLWAPDIVAWATRRMIGLQQLEYVRPLKEAKNYQLFQA